MVLFACPPNFPPKMRAFIFLIGEKRAHRFSPDFFFFILPFEFHSFVFSLYFLRVVEMSHRVEINLNSATDRAEQARADVAEAHKLQQRAQALKVIILVGTMLIILFLLYALLEYDMCQFLSFC
ncbi:hypothetical protein B9Z55_024299 [Caenorhabditis nigoni]|nr:hypothetical protein B9Z55_024299 [Caenorhabditis nigoni]